MAGNNVNTKLLLHMNGADESTSFIDSRTTGTPHIVTAGGDAQIDTAIKKFGSASGLFDGTSDYLTIPDSADWDIFGSNADDWTIDLQVKMDTTSSDRFFITHYEDGSNNWQFWHEGGGLRMKLRRTTNIINLSGGIISDTDWHHVAFIKVADKYGLYLDGNQTAYVQDSDTDTFSGQLVIGASGNLSDSFFDGHMDELRIQHSNYFGAAPNVGLSNTITEPIEEYSAFTGFPHSQGYIIS